jgi:hypothetical protein
MRISTATIDCWFQVIGPNNYNDFQHHHWYIGPSGPISTAVGNTATYTWILNAVGSDSNWNWSAINQPKTLINGAKVRINSSNVVELTQAAINQLPATGTNSHPVSELTWPIDLTWSPNAGTPSSLIFRDMGQPSYQLLFGPPVGVPVPGTHPPGTVSAVLVASMSLLPSTMMSGIGGRDYTTQPNWQKPSGSSALAWWAWTINLV